MVEQESSSADNQSSILFQKPNIRTDVQKSSSAQTEAKRKNWSLKAELKYTQLQAAKDYVTATGSDE